MQFGSTDDTQSNAITDTQSNATDTQSNA